MEQASTQKALTDPLYPNSPNCHQNCSVSRVGKGYSTRLGAEKTA